MFHPRTFLLPAALVVLAAASPARSQTGATLTPDRLSYMVNKDLAGERWTTVGVSPNIIDASFQALMDSVVYKLVKSNAPA